MVQKLTIGKLAQAAGVNVETIRYYQRIGLLDTPDKPVRGHRRYPQSALQRLRFIKMAQTTGFSLDEIDSLLHFDKNRNCTGMHMLLEKKMEMIKRRLAELTFVHDRLSCFLCHCDGEDCAGNCPVIHTLNQPVPY